MPIKVFNRYGTEIIMEVRSQLMEAEKMKIDRLARQEGRTQG